MRRALAQLRRWVFRIARGAVHGRAQAEADRMARSIGLPVGQPSGGVHDAFTHAYVSARLSLVVGEGLAARLGELNELVGSIAAGKPHEAEMDHHNNAVGRSIARTLSRDGVPSREALADEVGAALDAGRLRVLDRSGRLVPACRSA